MEATMQRVREILSLARLPGAIESTSWGTPAFKVNKKMLVRVREPGVVVLICDMDEKEFLMVGQPEVFYQTDHYADYPAILVRMELVDPEDFIALAEKAWRQLASPKMLREASGVEPDSR